MASRFLLTDKAIRALPAPSKKQRMAEHYDTQQPGLVLRHGYSDKKTWYLTARLPRGGKSTPARIKLGVFPEMSLKDARDTARSTLLQIRDGKDPTLLRREVERQMLAASARTFEVVRDEYLARKQRRWSERHYNENRRILYSFRDWTQVPVSQLTVDDVENVVDRIVDEGKTAMAAHTRTALITFFDWCAEPRRKYIGENPAKAVERPADNAHRIRILSDDEIRDFWRALCFTPPGKEPNISMLIRRMLRLLLITGQRTNEVRLMEVGELSLDEKLWEIPPSKLKTGKKTRQPHVVPLSDLALRELQELPADGYVFRSRIKRGNPKGTPFTNKVLSKAVVRFHVWKGAPRDNRWTPHDLRRTARSNMSKAKVPSEHAERALGHLVGGAMQRTYDRYEYFDEKREALCAWEQMLWARVADIELEGLV